MTVVTYKRAAAENPAKHGPLDWRVTVGDVAPTHSETLFMLGMKLIAEDRYNRPGNLGRYALWYWVDQLLLAKTPERVAEIAAACDDAVAESRRARARMSA
jgi:hypothetical protein